MASPRDEFDRALDHAPAIAVVSAERADWGMHVASACVAAGFQLLAVDVHTPEATQIIASVAARPDMIVGLARTRTAAHVAAAQSAGARFVMGPTGPTEVGEAARGEGLLWIAGAVTPGEIERVVAAGADLVQIYPAGTSGGPVHVRLMSDLFPEVPLVAGGGIGGDRMTAYFGAGAHAVALSEALYSRDLMAAGEHMTIRNHAATAHREATQHGRVQGGQR